MNDKPLEEEIHSLEDCLLDHEVAKNEQRFKSQSEKNIQSQMYNVWQ